MYAMWYYLQEHLGTDGGAAKLGEHLAAVNEAEPVLVSPWTFSIAERLASSIFSPDEKAEVWQELMEVKRKASSYDNHVRYLLWETLAGISRCTSSAGIFENYAKSVFKVLDRTAGKVEGVAAELLDMRNAETIAQKVDDVAFWQSLSGVVSEVPVSSPGAWVPETSEGAASLLDAVKGPNFVAEKELLAASIDDIAERTGYGPILNVLDLGVGNGEKLAAMLKALEPRLEQINACVVDKNFFIAFAGAEELIRSLKFAGGELFFDNKSVSLHGKVRTQQTGTPVTITAIVEYFERLKQHHSYQEFSGKQPDYLTTMLGTTLCNFEPETAMVLLGSIAQRHALVGLYLYPGDDAKLIQEYDTHENIKMGQHHLVRQGVNEEDFGKLEHFVEVRKRHEMVGQSGLGIVARLLTYFKVRPGQKVQGALREFSADDVINVGLSLKYTDEQARKLFESSGFGLVNSYYAGSVGLYLVERLPVQPNVHVSGR